VTSSITNRRAMGTFLSFLYAPYWTLNRLVSEILSIKVADRHTYARAHRHIETSTDNKGRLKLAAREPINKLIRSAYREWVTLKNQNSLLPTFAAAKRLGVADREEMIDSATTTNHSNQLYFCLCFTLNQQQTCRQTRMA